jgi:hypothetical protein
MSRIQQALPSVGIFMLLSACGGGGGNTSTGSGTDPSTDVTVSNVQFSEAMPSGHNASRQLLAQTPTFISNGGVLSFLQSTSSAVYPSFSMVVSFNNTSGLLERVGLSVIDQQYQTISMKYQCGPDMLAPYYPNDVTHDFPCTTASADINKKSLKATQQKMWLIDELGVYVIGTNAKSIVATAGIQ